MIEAKKILVLGMAICISACTPCAQLKKPNRNYPQKYTNESNLISTEQQVTLGKSLKTQWWKLFAADSLNTVIQQALDDNYTLVIAQRNLNQAQEAIKSASGALWPQIGLPLTAGNQKYGVALFGPTEIKIPDFTYYEFGPTLDWNIDIFGSTRYTVAYKRALAEYQLRNLEATYLLLTSNVVTQALEIAAAKAEIAAIEAIIADDLKTLALVETKYKIGSGTKVDILSMQARTEGDKSILPAIKQRIKIAEHALAILVGKAPSEWTPPDFVMSNFVLPQKIPLCLPSELVRNRPDILAAEANLHAASANVGIATANIFPSLNITANTFQEALTPAGLFKAGANAYAMAATLAAPLFTGGTLTAEQRKAEQAYQAALAEYEQTVLIAFQQVADALTALQHDAEAMELERQAWGTAKSALQLSQLSYQLGNGDLLQVQDLQRSAAQAELNLIRAQRQQFIDTARLFVALGGSPMRKEYCPS